MTSPYRSSAKPPEPCDRVHFGWVRGRVWRWLAGDSGSSFVFKFFGTIFLVATGIGWCVYSCEQPTRDCDSTCATGAEGRVTPGGRCVCIKADYFDSVQR